MGFPDRRPTAYPPCVRYCGIGRSTVGSIYECAAPRACVRLLRPMGFGSSAWDRRAGTAPMILLTQFGRPVSIRRRLSVWRISKAGISGRDLEGVNSATSGASLEIPTWFAAMTPLKSRPILGVGGGGGLPNARIQQVSHLPHRRRQYRQISNKTQSATGRNYRRDPPDLAYVPETTRNQPG